MKALFYVAMGCLLGCANDLRTDHPFDGETSTGPLVSAEMLEGGARRLVVDATNKMSQVYVDLDEGREMKPSEAFDTNGWELAFKRFDVFVNSGASGPGLVEVAVLKGIDYNTLTQSPAEGYTHDTPDRVFNTVAEGWYYYDLGVHRLTPRAELTYLIHTSAGNYVKLRILGYYDANGTPASISLEYAPIAPP